MSSGTLEPSIHSGVNDVRPKPRSSSLRENLRMLGSRLLPHDTRETTCPPGELVSSEGPTIIIPSLMRSGTHLLLDALFNNFPALRRRPLFVDWDAYERASLAPDPLRGLKGVTIKTHYPQTPLREPYVQALAEVAARAIILRPRRPASEVMRSLAKWDQQASPEEFARVEQRFDEFWGRFAPIEVQFSSLLKPEGVASLARVVWERAGVSVAWRPVMPSSSRLGVYIDKLFTRALGGRTRRINTTIGYRLRSRS